MGRGRSNRVRVEAALTALLERQNADAFVIFEEKKSGKFVQFAGGAGQDLFLDLPFQTLDAAEAKRAETYFRELAVQAEEYDVFEAPGGKVSGRQRSFQKSFGRDVEGAAAVTLQVFERVYQFAGEFQLVVQEN